MSLGCATLLPSESGGRPTMRADSALYVAKRTGRNRLSMATWLSPAQRERHPKAIGRLFITSSRLQPQSRC